MANKPRRFPYALPKTLFEPSQASREAAWDGSVFGVSPPVQQLYSNALSIILCCGIKNRASILDRPRMINGLSARAYPFGPPFRFLLTFYELLVADWLGVCQYFYHFS